MLEIKAFGRQYVGNFQTLLFRQAPNLARNPAIAGRRNIYLEEFPRPEARRDRRRNRNYCCLNSEQPLKLLEPHDQCCCPHIRTFHGEKESCGGISVQHLSGAPPWEVQVRGLHEKKNGDRSIPHRYSLLLVVWM